MKPSSPRGGNKIVFSRANMGENLGENSNAGFLSVFCLHKSSNNKEIFASLLFSRSYITHSFLLLSPPKKKGEGVSLSIFRKHLSPVFCGTAAVAMEASDFFLPRRCSAVYGKRQAAVRRFFKKKKNGGGKRISGFPIQLPPNFASVMHLTFSHFFLGPKKGFYKKFWVLELDPSAKNIIGTRVLYFPIINPGEKISHFLFQTPKTREFHTPIPKKVFSSSSRFELWIPPPFSCPFFTGEEETSSSQPFRGKSGDVILSGVRVFFFSFFFCWKGRKTIELLEGCRQDASSPGIQIATSWDLAGKKNFRHAFYGYKDMFLISLQKKCQTIICKLVSTMKWKTYMIMLVIFWWFL